MPPKRKISQHVIRDVRPALGPNQFLLEAKRNLDLDLRLIRTFRIEYNPHEWVRFWKNQFHYVLFELGTVVVSRVLLNKADEALNFWLLQVTWLNYPGNFGWSSLNNTHKFTEPLENLFVDLTLDE